MRRTRRESPFWRSVGARVLVILLAGWLSILWFRGCLVPQVRDEMQQNQRKASDPTVPPPQ
jgi:hypothetical protein